MDRHWSTFLYSIHNYNPIRDEGLLIYLNTRLTTKRDKPFYSVTPLKAD